MRRRTTFALSPDFPGFERQTSARCRGRRSRALPPYLASGSRRNELGFVRVSLEPKADSVQGFLRSLAAAGVLPGGLLDGIATGTASAKSRPRWRCSKLWRGPATSTQPQGPPRRRHEACSTSTPRCSAPGYPGCPRPPAVPARQRPVGGGRPVGRRLVPVRSTDCSGDEAAATAKLVRWARESGLEPDAAARELVRRIHAEAPLREGPSRPSGPVVRQLRSSWTPEMPTARQHRMGRLRVREVVRESTPAITESCAGSGTIAPILWCLRGLASGQRRSLRVDAESRVRHGPGLPGVFSHRCKPRDAV